MLGTSQNAGTAALVLPTVLRANLKLTAYLARPFLTYATLQMR